MILSYILLQDDSEIVVVGLEPGDVDLIMRGTFTMELSKLGDDAPHLHRVRLEICGPNGTERLLRNAVAARDAGVDVRYPETDEHGAP